jgi:glycosyltransferase involved in cell wall biosynthesis/2-polyprenyl-3-methyl-5-hydroxy-6-metoxy-1,4-benzoquinol methylase
MLNQSEHYPECWCHNKELIPFSPGYLKCPACETLIAEQFPDKESLNVESEESSLYGREYWFAHQREDLHMPDIISRARSDLSERCLHWLSTLLKYKLPPARILEIGSAHGGFVALLRQAGFDATGLELSPWITDFARQTFDIPMLCGPVEKQDLPSKTFDAVILMDILEHFPEPEITLRHCLNLLKKDGLLLIQTPCLPENKSYSDLVSEQHRFVEMLRPDEHLYLFSSRALQKFFHRLGAKHIQPKQALFAHYDMFVVVSKHALPVNRPLGIDEALGSTSGGRLIQALLDLQKKLHEIQANYDIAETDRAARLEVIEQQGRRLVEIDAERNSLQTQVLQLTQMVKTSEQSQVSQSKALETTKLNLMDSEIRHQYLSSRLAELGEQITSLTIERNNHLVQILDLSRQTEEMNTENSFLKEQADSLQNRLASAEADERWRAEMSLERKQILAAVENGNLALQKQVTTYQQMTQKFIAEQTDLLALLETQKAEMARQQKAFEQLKDEGSILQEQIAELEEKLQGNEVAKLQLFQEIQQQQGENQSLNKSLLEMKEVYSSLSKKLDLERQDHIRARQEKDQLKKETVLLKEKIAAYLSEHARNEQDLEKQKDRINELRYQNSELEIQIHQLLTRQQELDRQKEAIEQDLLTERNDFSSLKAEFSKGQQENKTALERKEKKLRWQEQRLDQQELLLHNLQSETARLQQQMNQAKAVLNLVRHTQVYRLIRRAGRWGWLEQMIDELTEDNLSLYQSASFAMPDHSSGIVERSESDLITPAMTSKFPGTDRLHSPVQEVPAHKTISLQNDTSRLSRTRIAVDLTPLLPGGANGGIKFMVIELIRHISQIASDYEFILLTSESSHDEIAWLECLNVHRLCVQKSDGTPVFSNGRVTLPPYLKPEATESGLQHSKKSLLRQIGARLLFCPFTAPFFFDPTIPVISVVCDLQYAFYPQFFQIYDRQQRHKHFLEACRLSTRVICISDYVRETVLEQSDLSPEQVITIHIQTPQRFPDISSEFIEETLEKLGLVSSRFLLFPANFWLHKNHALMLTAWGIYAQTHPQSDLKLVCTGTSDENKARLAEAASRMKLKNHVMFADHLPESEFAVLLQSAKAVIFPSLYEGFGMPVLEAMAAGKPVLCSHVTSLPEVAGDAALYFHPGKPHEIAATIARIENNPALADEMKEKGYQRVLEFSDSIQMARQYLQVFEEALTSHEFPANSVTGLYPDGWMGDSLSIAYKKEPESQGSRQLEMTFEFPSWAPAEQVRLQVLGNRQELPETYIIRRNETVTIHHQLSASGGVIDIVADQAYQPSAIGLNDDSRLISCFCSGCRIISPGDYADLLQKRG